MLVYVSDVSRPRASTWESARKISTSSTATAVQLAMAEQCATSVSVLLLISNSELSGFVSDACEKLLLLLL